MHPNQVQGSVLASARASRFFQFRCTMRLGHEGIVQQKPVTESVVRTARTNTPHNVYRRTQIAGAIVCRVFPADDLIM